MWCINTIIWNRVWFMTVWRVRRLDVIHHSNPICVIMPYLLAWIAVIIHSHKKRLLYFSWLNELSQAVHTVVITDFIGEPMGGGKKSDEFISHHNSVHFNISRFLSSSLELYRMCRHVNVNPVLAPFGRILRGDPVAGVRPHLSDHLPPDVAAAGRPVRSLPARLLRLLHRYLAHEAPSNVIPQW